MVQRPTIKEEATDMNQLIRLARRVDLSFVPRWIRPAGKPRQGSRDAADSTLTGFSPSTLELQRIENSAERAIVQELRLFERHVRRMVPELRGDDLAYASGLLLKLDRKAREQLADTTAPRSVQLLPSDGTSPTQ
ncbi:MAG: hypothetical protein RL375_4395 [Pseudomonadota bacterium]